MPEIEVETSEWWIKTLCKRLDDRAKDIKSHRDYYEGKQPLAFSSDRWRADFGDLFKDCSDNFCEVVVDSVEERVKVKGFRMGSKPDIEADTDAWRIWQANNLDSMSKIAHRSALVTAYSYALVWSDDDDPDTPVITIEDPLEMIVDFDGGNLQRRRAALKRWKDESGYVYLTLYLPDRIEKYRSSTKVHTEIAWASGRTWVKREVEGESWPLDNPLGVVPVVAFVNRHRGDGTGRSEIANIERIQDLINKYLADMTVASEFTSFLQRWATGIDIPVDPETGQPIETFKVAVDRLLVVADADAKFGEFSQSDPEVWVKPIEMLIQHIATQTRTPPHYFNSSMGQFPSGESLKATETGLVSKCVDKMDEWAESWEEVIRIAFKVLGDERGNIIDSETIWFDAESRTESEFIDSLVKQKTLGIPDEILWEKAGYTPQEIVRIKELIRRNPPIPVDEDPAA